MPENVSIDVSAPSRLHFGLFSIGNLTERKFGGVGVMIDLPTTQITLTPSSRFRIVAADERVVGRIEKIVARWFAGLAQVFGGSVDELPVRVSVHRAPPSHIGLGSGTQLTYAITSALFRFFDLPLPSPHEIGLATGRAGRSAIGTYGFFRGGFLVDRGLVSEESIAPLDFQTPFPDWPILLVWPRTQAGLHGAAEMEAFRNLPPTTTEVRQTLVGIVKNRMVPAIVQRDFQQFAPAVTELGFRSGQFYSSVQGGPYAGPVVTAVVEHIQAHSDAAVGQSSWGPTVFAIVSCDEDGKKLVSSLADQFPEHEISITAANNIGASIKRRPS